MPHVPTPKQCAFLMVDDLEAFYGGAAGGGKLLRVDEPVFTPSGWMTMGQLVAGDIVFDDLGMPCHVVEAFNHTVPEKSYRLKFDDGTYIECGPEHRWITFDNAQLAALSKNDPEWRARRRERRASRVSGHKSEKFTASLIARNKLNPTPVKQAPCGTIRTTSEIAATLRTESGRTNHAAPVAGSIDLPEVSLPIDPYVLGAWLGDGMSSSGSMTTADIEILGPFAPFSPHKTSSKYGYGTYGLTRLLRQAGVLNNKHVPESYLLASAGQRLALLQGLMDTDGHACASGAVEFTSTKRCLAEAVREIAVSLGWKATLQEGTAKLYGRIIGPNYRVKWSPDKPVFRLERKLQRQRIDGHRRTTRFRYIVEAEPCTPTLMRCISVDSPSHLYLAGRSLIPTHNSDALLMAALQYVDIPGYSALLFRRTYADLSLPGALMDRAAEWLYPTDAQWNDKTKTWKFPSGATVTFGYLESEQDKFRYQSSEVQFCGFDELTSFTESQYRYLFSRLRRLKTSDIPLRMRSASNPGGIGHDWVKQRFIVEGHSHGRLFIPARMADNPHLDAESYAIGLDKLDSSTRRQLRDGDWDATAEGTKFQRDWFEIVDAVPTGCRLIRFWDMAATEARRGKDPDWTAGCLMGISPDKTLYIMDMRRLRGTPLANERLVKQTAELDGRHVAVRMEQEPGSSGVKAIDDYRRRVLMGFDFKGIPSTGSKEVRANPLSSQAGAGNVKLVRGTWIGDFLDEAESFPGGSHDDQVDAAAAALAELTKPRGLHIG